MVDVSELLTATVTLEIQATVVCPHCEADIDIYDSDTYLDIELAYPKSPSTNEYDNMFSTPRLLNGTDYLIKCECGESFVVDDFDII